MNSSADSRGEHKEDRFRRQRSSQHEKDSHKSYDGDASDGGGSVNRMGGRKTADTSRGSEHYSEDDFEFSVENSQRMSGRSRSSSTNTSAGSVGVSMPHAALSSESHSKPAIVKGKTQHYQQQGHAVAHHTTVNDRDLSPGAAANAGMSPALGPWERWESVAKLQRTKASGLRTDHALTSQLRRDVRQANSAAQEQANLFLRRERRRTSEGKSFVPSAGSRAAAEAEAAAAQLRVTSDSLQAAMYTYAVMRRRKPELRCSWRR